MGILIKLQKTEKDRKTRMLCEFAQVNGKSGYIRRFSTLYLEEIMLERDSETEESKTWKKIQLIISCVNV